VQLTIDSSEPLDRVLEVIGALYGTRLTRQEESPASTTAPAAEAAAAPRRAAPSRSAQKGSAGRSARATQDVDLQAVRAWAREQGHTVSARGRLSKALIDAYQQRAA